MHVDGIGDLEKAKPHNPETNTTMSEPTKHNYDLKAENPYAEIDQLTAENAELLAKVEQVEADCEENALTAKKFQDERNCAIDRAEQAEAKCTEMRWLIQQIRERCDVVPQGWSDAADSVLSANCGKGWASPEERDEEIGRWQNEIYQLLCKFCPDINIDGAGSDSGDPLDFTVSEIGQALAHLQNKIDERLSPEKAAELEAGCAEMREQLLESRPMRSDLHSNDPWCKCPRCHALSTDCGKPLLEKITTLESELAKWKEGCLVNADNAKGALREQDNQRLVILGFKKRLKVLEEALKDVTECAQVVLNNAHWGGGSQLRKR